jgi:hypothetical protein
MLVQLQEVLVLIHKSQMLVPVVLLVLILVMVPA